MPQQPAVVIIARHGPRLDAADQAWHLSTPTPYDPPLTYGGWNQSQALGIRIASLLHAREKATDGTATTEQSNAPPKDAVTALDFAQGNGKRKDAAAHEAGGQKRSKTRHRVVIHTSPFLRCVQTSVAIAAGIAQFRPSGRDGDASPRPRTPLSLHSASPKIRAHDHAPPSTYLAPIAEPEHHVPSSLPHTKVKLRVDAFLGEWLNPQYFEQITPPPPSAMMVATAKAELLSKEDVDVYTPTVSSKSSYSPLWGGADGEHIGRGALDDMTVMQDALPSAAASTRSRASTVSSAGGSDSHWRPGHAAKRSFSPAPNEPAGSFYQPLRPQYAVSGSDHIPRGYVSHARRACVDVDYHWDSSRPPQSWVDGGSYGEEWSAMHKRFRKGLNHLVQWYSHHDIDAGTETEPEIDPSESKNDAEDEDLVVVLVTHGAGSNALIGALTNQPVLLDVGMASLTMAVRRDDILPSDAAQPESTSQNEDAMMNGWSRRPSVDLGLSSKYEMRLVSSSEHLRVNSSKPAHLGATRPDLPAFVENHWNPTSVPSRRSTSSAVGSIRRPSAANLFAPRPDPLGRSDSLPVSVLASRSEDVLARPSPPPVPGLWTPPTGRSPFVAPQELPALSPSSNVSAVGGQIPNPPELSKLPERRFSPMNHPSVIDEEDSVDPTETNVPRRPLRAMAQALQGQLEESPASSPVNDSAIVDDERKRGSISDLPPPGTELPSNLRRGLSQKGLWGARPGGDRVQRRFGQEPKRRWTVNRD